LQGETFGLNLVDPSLNLPQGDGTREFFLSNIKPGRQEIKSQVPVKKCSFSEEKMGCGGGQEEEDKEDTENMYLFPCQGF
jgi:hypothetical protein